MSDAGTEEANRVDSRGVLRAALVALGSGLAIRLAILAGGRDLIPDGVVDLEMARAFTHGHYREAILMRFHPLAGALEAVLGAVLRREPDETCGILVSLVAGALVPFFVALTAGGLASFTARAGTEARPSGAARAALAAGVLAAAHPYLARAGASVWSYPLAHMALAAALLCTVLGAVREKRIYFFLAGLACGLGYLARPDGVVLFVGVASGVAFVRSRFAAIVLVIAGFALLASPYLLALHDVDGRWRLTLKKDERHLMGVPDPNPHPEVAVIASDVSVMLSPPPGPKQESGTAGAVLQALGKTADAVHPLIIILGAIGLAVSRRARLAHAPALVTLGAFFLAHVFLKKNEGYLSKEHATGEAAIFLAWAGLGASVIATRLSSGSEKKGRIALGVLLLVSLAILLPKTLERREAAKDRAEREVAAAIAERWAALSRTERPPELRVAGNDAHVRSVAFLAGGHLADLPRGDAAAVVSQATSQGTSFLALYVRSHEKTRAETLRSVRAELSAAGLQEPRQFEEGRDDGSVVYTWLLYELPRRTR